MLACMANLVQQLAGERAIVRHAHMEIAQPDIDAGVAACIDAGATDVIVFPYMLSPGRHSTSDIPRMVAAAAAEHTAVRVRVTPAFGVHEKLAEVILERAGLSPLNSRESAAESRCWEPEGEEGRCGAACRALSDTTAAASLAARTGSSSDGAA